MLDVHGGKYQFNITNKPTPRAQSPYDIEGRPRCWKNYLQIIVSGSFYLEIEGTPTNLHGSGQGHMTLCESVEDIEIIYAHEGEALPGFKLDLPSKFCAGVVGNIYLPLKTQHKKKHFFLAFS